MVKNLPTIAGDRSVCGGWGLHLWIRKIPWRSKWQPTPVFLLGKSYGQKSLEGYSSQGHKRVRHDFETKQLMSVCYTMSLLELEACLQLLFCFQLLLDIWSMLSLSML